MFGRDNEPGTATIVKRHLTGGTVEDGPVYEYLADVRVEGAVEAFRCVIKQPPLMTRFRPPAEAAQVKVLANLKHKTAKFDKSDPQLTLQTKEKAEDADWEQAKLGAAGEGGFSIEEGVDQATGPSDHDLQAAYDAMHRHNENVEAVKASGDKAQIDEWVKTFNELSEQYNHMKFERPDWTPSPRNL